MSFAGAAAEEAVLDVRTYKLKRNAGAHFDALMRDEVLPMLERYGISVVAYGASLDLGGIHYLIRSFPSEVERDLQLGSFYGSDEWRERYRTRILSLIDEYHVVCLPLNRSFRAGLFAAVTDAHADEWAHHDEGANFD